jgi:glycosyltransferase involved in cell wall biosynthesis
MVEIQVESSALPPRVSVAMCTYNGAAYLEDQLTSIARQTLLPCELVVCDDRSTDATVEMLEDFVAKAPFPVRIIVNEANLGTTRNFEKALRLCTGEFLALCDQDDAWVPEKLQKLAGMLQADPGAGGAFSDAALFDGAAQIQGDSLWQRFHFGTAKQEKFRRDPVPILLMHDIVTGATLMIRRSVLDEFEHIPNCWLQDGWLTWVIVLSGKMLLTAEKLTHYRLHASQQVGTGRMGLAERIKSIRRAERARYLNLVKQCEAVLGYIAQHRPAASDIARELAAKAAFLRRRAKLDSGMAGKVWFIATNIGNYGRYARGARSMRKDLVL